MYKKDSYGQRPLTRRQKQVLVGIVAGKNDVEIGRELKIDPQTVASHTTAIYTNLCLGMNVSRTQLAEYAVEHCLVDVEEQREP